MTESRVIMNGFMRVTSDGRFFFKERDGERELFPSNRKITKEGVTKTYKIVSYPDLANRRITNTTAGRLLAEAFIPNPNNSKVVAYKDGDRTNIDLENLQWYKGTQMASDSMRRAIRNMKDKYPTCMGCDAVIRRQAEDEQYCLTCNKANRLKQKEAELVAHFTAVRETLLSSYLTEPMSPNQRKVIDLRIQGHSMQSIADRMGVTRQAVSLKLKRLEEKAEQVKNHTIGADSRLIRDYSAECKGAMALREFKLWTKPRQKVVELKAQGLDNQRIAKIMDLSEVTVYNHVLKAARLYKNQK